MFYYEPQHAITSCFYQCHIQATTHIFISMFNAKKIPILCLDMLGFVPYSNLSG